MGQTHAKKDLTPEEFDQLVRSSGFTHAEVHDFYEKFKKDFPKGYLDKKGFATVYASMFPQGSGADKFSEHVFRIYDADKNNQISFQEFVAALHVGARGTPEEKLRSTFRMYDENRNGTITQAELSNILTAIFKSRKDPQAAANGKREAEVIMNQLDTDHNKKLSEQEFLRAAVGNPRILHVLEGN